ncbi:hypothetical protein SAV1949 [Staphylococcus aureus subsp. aureus Mu50]|uniref:Uncharacterized protein n=1 Tax=Staphylococcus aureus (strain Mu50 / ATCC 700699) TaxID=158878 RepID=A0A0H3JS83_STAAM|nr:hypothetical protein SAV1949 [Staphylococcus aureus subsp. aureus Mu50]BAF78818.1 hypothetical protein SAHV_1935 [Staphylococcus aureus subsp. aureus Mu3]
MYYYTLFIFVYNKKISFLLYYTFQISYLLGINNTSQLHLQYASCLLSCVIPCTYLFSIKIKSQCRCTDQKHYLHLRPYK